MLVLYIGTMNFSTYYPVRSTTLIPWPHTIHMNVEMDGWMDRWWSKSGWFI